MKIERAQGLAWRKVGNETIVIHLGRQRIFGLDEAGGRVWEALEEGREISDLEGVVSDGVVVEAIHRFVADLASEGLVEIEGGATIKHDDDVVVDFPSPRIEWREGIQRFAGACGLNSGASKPCNQAPFRS